MNVYELLPNDDKRFNIITNKKLHKQKIHNTLNIPYYNVPF
jgi:hypothetical protein